VCKLLKIIKIQTITYDPESNEALERSHRTLAEYLQHYINKDWDEWILYVRIQHYTAHSNNLYSIRVNIRAPGYTAYGSVIISEDSTDSAPMNVRPYHTTYTYDNYAEELKQKLRVHNKWLKHK